MGSMKDRNGRNLAKMGSMKYTNGRDLTEAEDIRRGGKNTQKNYIKKILMTHIIRWCGQPPRARHPGM